MKQTLLVMLVALSLAACGDNSSQQAKKEAEPPAGAPALTADGRTPSPPGAKVTILEPKDGATAKSPVTVKFGVAGMEVVQAGTDKPNSGHHHLFIDTKLDDPTTSIPADANHIHYGKGQTEAQVELAPGKHTLQDVFADKNHMPHDPPVVSDVVTITVE
jgi:hypothetical protein